MSQSEIIRSESKLPAKRQSRKPKTGQPISVEVETQADAGLVDVAIAAADAPFAAATQAFNHRYGENLRAFGEHVVSVQQATAAALKAQIYRDYGINEGDIYGD